jgi:hypothetical protein
LINFNNGSYLPDLQRSEQYLTFSQSLAHFLRHSNSNPQRTHTFGGKPFFIFARMGRFNSFASFCNSNLIDQASDVLP